MGKRKVSQGISIDIEGSFSEKFSEQVQYSQEISNMVESNEINQTSHKSKKKYELKEEKIAEFLQKLGNLKQNSINLANYQNQFSQGNIKNQVNFVEFKKILDKSIKKISQQKKFKKNWSKDDLIIFLWVLEKYSLLFDKQVYQYNQQDWIYVSNIVPGKNSEQCMFKWLALKTNCQQEKFPWTQSEDQLLIKLLKQSSNKHWLQISKQIYNANPGFKVFRTAKQCRQRWACFLNPQIVKGPWSIQEDYLLLQNFIKTGKKWSQIAKCLNGRTQNAIKNRFSLLLNKSKIKTLKGQIQYAKSYIQNLELNSFLSSSTLSISPMTNFTFEKQLIDQDNQCQLKNHFSVENLKITTILQQNAENIAMSQIFSENESNVEEKMNAKIVTFQKIKNLIKTFSQICRQIQLFPAIYDEYSQEVSFKQIKPVIKTSLSLQGIQNIENMRNLEEEGTSIFDLLSQYQSNNEFQIK